MTRLDDMAVEMATAVTFQQLSGFQLDPVEMALFGQKAENEFVGVNTGIDSGNGVVASLYVPNNGMSGVNNATEQLIAVDARIVGVVLNNADLPSTAWRWMGADLPDHVDAMIGMAELDLVRNDTEKAIEWAEQAIKHADTELGRKILQYVFYLFKRHQFISQPPAFFRSMAGIIYQQQGLLILRQGSCF